MPANEINWNIQPEEGLLIAKIAARYGALVKRSTKRNADIEGHIMDLTATHLNGCPLKLAALAEADEFNLAHDVGGIYQHINRRTGKLERCFLPRFADLEKMECAKSE